LVTDSTLPLVAPRWRAGRWRQGFYRPQSGLDLVLWFVLGFVAGWFARGQRAALESLSGESWGRLSRLREFRKRKTLLAGRASRVLGNPCSTKVVNYLLSSW